MSIRVFISLLGISIALISFNSFAQDAQATPAAAATPVAPTHPANSATTTPPADKNQPVNDDDINRFTNTIVLIKDFYVQPVNDKTLLDSAIRGMVSGLDPHSEYLRW